MASTDVLPPPSSQHDPAFKLIDPFVSPSKRKRSDSVSGSPVPSQISKMLIAEPPKLTFDPSKHVKYTPPSKVWSMKDIGKNDEGISPNAVSEPFELFTVEAIAQMRSEVLSQRVIANCKYHSNLAQFQLRGMAPE